MIELAERDFADAYCRRLAERHYENFSVAAWHLPAPLRLDLMRVYAYCRVTDDLGDESNGAARERLGRWGDEVGELFGGGAPVHPVLVALRDTVERHRLPARPFLDLIDANVRDQEVTSYAAWPELREYCMLSAAPVGRLVLRLFGLRGAPAEQLSDDVCVGLQLANFAQDVGVDAAKGRTYLLGTELEAEGVAGATRAHCARARRLLASGRALEAMAPTPLRLQLALYRLGGLAICDAIERASYRTDVRRPRVSPTVKASLVVRAALEAARRNGDGAHADATPEAPPAPSAGAPPVAASPVLDLRESERVCQRMARREAKNFYWGFISLPRHQRSSIYALYDFSRQVDDEADDASRPRLADCLAAHRERARRCARGEYSDPVTQVLARAVERYSIPESELQAVIDGVELDFRHTRYRTWEELRGYCCLVASAVGRMCVRIFGFRDPAALERADDLGLALQLTNILRDVREDARMGRIYLPEEDRDRFGVTERDLLDGRPSAGWRALVDFEARRARALFADGLRVLDYIPRRPRACVGTMAGIYSGVLSKIEHEPELPLRERASLGRGEKLRVVLASWLRAV
jgi:phytoene synthase